MIYYFLDKRIQYLLTSENTFRFLVYFVDVITNVKQIAVNYNIQYKRIHLEQLTFRDYNDPICINIAKKCNSKTADIYGLPSTGTLSRCYRRSIGLIGRKSNRNLQEYYDIF